MDDSLPAYERDLTRSMELRAQYTRKLPPLSGIFPLSRQLLGYDTDFDSPHPTDYTRTMELDLSPELQAKLDEVAAQRGRDAKSLVKEAVERLVDYDAWFVREVEKGLAEIERGDVLEHDEVGARLENLLSKKQRHP